MKPLAIAVLIVTAAACSRPAEAPQAAAPAPVTAVPVAAGWTATQGIAQPESAYFDPQSGFIFVSQIEGQPEGRDGMGRIAKLNGDGTVVAADWVTGLNAPKGIRSYQGTLWVSDLDELVGVDIASGVVKARVKVAGAVSLNDVAIGADGTIYVSDVPSSSIFAVKGGVSSLFSDGDDLEYPNGLFVDGTRLIVGGWGKPEADFSTKVPGRLFALDLTTKAKTLITPEPFGNIDGVESDGRGGYLVTDWGKGQLLRVSATGQSTLVQQFTPGTADIGFIPSTGIVLIPHIVDNTVKSFDISAALQ